MILVADDNITLRAEVNKILLSQHSDVILFDSADALKTWLEERGPSCRPINLIVLGFLMPDVRNGKLCHTLRHNRFTGDTPIIITSSHDSIDNRVIARRLGCTDFLVHPILQDDLLIRAAVQIELHTLTTPRAKTANDRHCGTQPDPSAEKAPSANHEPLNKIAQILGSSQDQLLQSEKMAATGRLVASLAHEINNPLQAIHSSLQLITHFQLPPEKRAEYLGMANEEVERVINLVTRILDFARPSPTKPLETDISQIIDQVIKLTHKHTIHGKWRIATHLAADLPKVHIIPDQIAQVFLNVILNSLDAMPDGGDLTIRTTSRHNIILISFEDHGIGMTADTKKHLFEPFFSTKADSSGLGLTVSYEIINRHNGQIQIESVLNEGTAVHILLPCLSPKLYD